MGLSSVISMMRFTVSAQPADAERAPAFMVAEMVQLPSPCTSTTPVDDTVATAELLVVQVTESIVSVTGPAVSMPTAVASSAKDWPL